MIDDFESAEPEKKRKHGKYPFTRMSLEYIRNSGRLPEIVERLIPTGQAFPKRHDAFGLFDIIWLDPKTKEVGFVQTTSWQQRSAHKKKMLAGEGETTSVLLTLLAMGNAYVELYGWRKDDRGKWEITVERLVRIVELLGDRLEFVAIDAPTLKTVRAQARAREDAAEGF
jgi:hypothetical protein